MTFLSDDQGQPLLALTLWTGAALVIIAQVDQVHLHHRRRTSLPRERIHASPAIALLRRGPAATPEQARHRVSDRRPQAGTRHGLVPATAMPVMPTRMPESVRRAIRLQLTNELRALRTARRYLATRQSDLVSGLIDARDYGLPRAEVDRVRAAALDMGFAPAEIDHLMHVTGWPPATSRH